MREASGWDDGAAAGCPDMFPAGPAAGMGAGARGVSLTGGLSFLCTAGLGGISEGAGGSGAEKAAGAAGIGDAGTGAGEEGAAG